MKQSTRKQIANKKRGMGQKKKANRSISPHVLTNERWVVTVPGTTQKPLTFLSEEKATQVASAMARESNLNVEIDHQTFNGSEWVS